MVLRTTNFDAEQPAQVFLNLSMDGRHYFFSVEKLDGPQESGLLRVGLPTIVFYTERLRELRAELEAAGDAPGAIAKQSWGDLDFRVRDPDGYYVRVSEGTAVPPVP